MSSKLSWWRPAWKDKKKTWAFYEGKAFSTLLLTAIKNTFWHTVQLRLWRPPCMHGEWHWTWEKIRQIILRKRLSSARRLWFHLKEDHATSHGNHVPHQPVHFPKSGGSETYRNENRKRMKLDPGAGVLWLQPWAGPQSHYTCDHRIWAVLATRVKAKYTFSIWSRQTI